MIANVNRPLTPDKVRLSSIKPNMRSPSSPSVLACPLLLASLLLPACLSEVGNGADDDEKEDDEDDVVAQRWFLLMEEVNDCISCRRRVTGERSFTILDRTFRDLCPTRRLGSTHRLSSRRWLCIGYM